MAVVVQTFEGRLPADLYERLIRLRQRYARVLSAAAAGDFGEEEQLRVLSRRVGRLLAEAARTPVAERGGLPMLEISLAVDRLFPELRAWNQRFAAHYRPESRAAGW